MRKCKIIALKGVNNSGKTHTLMKVNEKLIEYSSKIKNGKVDGIFYINYLGKKIILCTGGDNLSLYDELDKYISNYEYDVIIIACRSCGDTVARLEELTTDNELDFIKKERQNDIERQKIDDEEKAEKIIAKLKKYCEE